MCQFPECPQADVPLIKGIKYHRWCSYKKQSQATDPKPIIHNQASYEKMIKGYMAGPIVGETLESEQLFFMSSPHRNTGKKSLYKSLDED